MSHVFHLKSKISNNSRTSYSFHIHLVSPLLEQPTNWVKLFRRAPHDALPGRHGRAHRPGEEQLPSDDTIPRSTRMDDAGLDRV